MARALVVRACAYYCAVRARTIAHTLLVAFMLALTLPIAAHAQLGEIVTGGTSHAKASRDQPVSFTSDTVEYDRENSLVIAEGHVEAWQGEELVGGIYGVAKPPVDLDAGLNRDRAVGQQQGGDSTLRGSQSCD